MLPNCVEMCYIVDRLNYSRLSFSVNEEVIALSRKKRSMAAVSATVLFAAMAVGISIGMQNREAKVCLPAESVSGIVAPEKDSTSQISTIDLNTATEEELMTLPNIGEKRAKAIIKYREDIGGFESVYQLEAISGIGEKILEDILPYLTLE